MKVGKIILITFVVIILLVGTTSVVLMKKMDRVVERSFEEGGQELFGSAVSLDDVDVTLLQGKARFEGLTIANPPGYSSKPVLTLGIVEVDLDLSSLDGKIIKIESILFRDPVVRYEINEAGVSNIDVIQEKIERKAPSSSQDTGLMIIDRLDVKGGSISASAALKPGKELVFDFPVMFMSDLGEPNGLPPEEIGAEIVEALMDRIMKAAQKAGVDSLVDKQKERLEDKANEKAEEKLYDILNGG